MEKIPTIDEQYTLDERNTDYVTVNNLQAGDSGPVITIKAPSKTEIEFIGTKDADNINNAHTLRTRLADKDDKSIDLMTGITIDYEFNKGSVRISKLFYSDISMIKDATYYQDIDLSKPIIMYRLKKYDEWYRFRNTVTLNKGEKLIISAIKPNQDIERIKFALDARIKYYS